MTKEEYKALLEKEVYRGTKKSEWLKRYRQREENPSTNAVYLIRRFQYYASQKGKYNQRIARTAQLKLIRRYNIFVNAKTEIGAGLMLPHPTGIILGITVKIGKNWKIFQGVTVGSAHNGDVKFGLQPHIGDGCTLFSGAAVIGSCTIGNNVTIGANAVMNKDAPDDSVWAGVPARRLK